MSDQALNRIADALERLAYLLEDAADALKRIADRMETVTRGEEDGSLGHVRTLDVA